MSEQPETNGQAHKNSSPQTAEVNAPEEPTVFERLLAIGAILLGIGVIIMGLDMATGGRLLGFATQEEQQP